MIHTSFRNRMLEAFRTRMYFFMSLVAFMFFIILVQLVNLQLVQGEEYKNRSRLNMENNIPIPASRGEIYDRTFQQNANNVVLVSSRPSFNITTSRAKFQSDKELKTVLNRLSRIYQYDTTRIYQEMKALSPWERFVVIEDVPFDLIVKIASYQHLFPHVEWEDAPVRVYNTGEMCAHVVGYIGSISQREYRDLRDTGYRHYQKIGKAGIEREYDTTLRGKDGFVRRIADAWNRTEGEEVGLAPEAGSNIVLTVDYEVQRVAWNAMKDLVGSVIAIKPATGEVIALVSKPDFDPNLVISKNNVSIIQELNANKKRPFLNRVIQSKYPPASTFKLLTAIAALETEKSYPEKTFFCSGKYTLKGYIDRDFYDWEAHGTMDLNWAIAKSCSVYFYQLGYKTGPTNILRYAGYFGFGDKTGIDIPGEVAGTVPSKKWKLKTWGQPWFDGDTLNLSIGQGFLSVTSIEMVNFVAAIVNSGVVYRPQLIKQVNSSNNSRVIRTTAREKIREIPLSPRTLSAVTGGMRLGVTSGTSGRLKYLKVPIAGKTGTAQTRSVRKEDFSQHAWWVGYAPYDGPVENAVAVVVMVEYGVGGALRAVPVAEVIFHKLEELGYFK
jgi:penicillin-binding protein 2